MHIAWDCSNKYLTFIFGKDWEKGEFKFFSFRKVPLGWDMNIWRFNISYDDFRKIRR